MGERKSREKRNKKQKITINSEGFFSIKKLSKKEVLILIAIIVLLGIAIYGIVSNAQKNNGLLEIGDNQKDQEKYVWGQVQAKTKNTNNYTMVTSADGIQVPVPTGYTASSVSGENSVSTGFVIYEGTDAVTSSNQWEAQCNRNQYVWVPISDVSDMYWSDSTTGKKYGTTYTFSSSSYSKSSSNKREPQTTSRDIQSTYLSQYANGISRQDLLQKMEIDFDEMLTSIATYGGYYIGRYQAGDLAQATPVVKRINSDIGSQTWYTMWKKSPRLSTGGANVHMIWGTQWDQTLKWLIDSGNKTYSEVGSDSTSWGNYYNNSFTYYTNTSKSTATKASRKSVRIPSGAYDGANANNVFDLAGNVWDWTCESNGSGTGYYRYVRGGYYNLDGYDYPAAYRDISGPNYSNSIIGLRCALYIK